MQRKKNHDNKRLFVWTYLHEYGHYDQSIRAFSSFCVIRVQLVIVVDQLNLQHTELHLSYWKDPMLLARYVNGIVRAKPGQDLSCGHKNRL